MKFSVAIYADPRSSAAKAALEFIRATLVSGHRIYRLFFFNEGARHGAVFDNAEDRGLINQSWAELISQNGLDAVVCVNSAQTHGISINGKTGIPLVQGFVIGGLGQLIDSVVNADRFITFG